MHRRLMFLVVFLLLFRASFAQRPTPGGWAEMTDAIYATDVSNIASLQGKTFVLDLQGVGTALTLEPARAFDLKLIGENKLQVTIVKPSLLIDADKVFTKFRPISFQVVGGDTSFRSSAIQGDVTCSFRLRFKQTGAKELNLAALPSSYKVTWDNEGAQLAIHQEGDGLMAERAAGDTAYATVRLHVVNAQRNLDLLTEWISVPACVPQKPPPPPPPPVVATAQAAPVENAPSLEAMRCLTMSVISMTPCKTCGSIYVTQQLSFTNHCARAVRCDGMQRTVEAQDVVISTEQSSIQVGAMLSQTQSIISQAVDKVETYTVKPPSGGACRFTEGLN